MPPSDDPFDRATVTPSQEVFAPRVLPGPKRAIEREPASLAPGIAQGGGIGAWPRLWSSETLTVTGSASGTVALFAMSNNQFAPPPALLPAGIKIDPTWGEFFVEAGLTAKYAIAPRLSAYGGVSYLESATRGHDESTNGNTYHGLAELAYGGVTLSGDVGVDLSYGQQEFTVGNGMLLWSGATNGTQRGADYLGPRGAWANAAVAKVTWHEMTVTAFWLKPNEAQALDTGTRIWGVNADWMPSGPLRAGFMYVHVPRSQIVTRDGLDVYDARLRWHPLFASPEFWLQGEYAWQRNVSVAASGGYVQAVWQFLPAWRVGARYDVLSPGSASYGANADLLDLDFTSRRSTAMLDWTPSEFSRLRLQFASDRSNPAATDRQLFLQYIMSLGAHGAHAF